MRDLAPLGNVVDSTEPVVPVYNAETSVSNHETLLPDDHVTNIDYELVTENDTVDLAFGMNDVAAPEEVRRGSRIRRPVVRLDL